MAKKIRRIARQFGKVYIKSLKDINKTKEKNNLIEWLYAKGYCPDKNSIEFSESKNYSTKKQEVSLSCYAIYLGKIKARKKQFYILNSYRTYF